MKQNSIVLAHAALLLGACAAGLRAETKLGPPPNWYRPQRLALAEEPRTKLAAEPTYQYRPLYGELVLGDAQNNRYAVVVDLAADWSSFRQALQPDQEPDLTQVPVRIYVDGNHDGDLTNDGDGRVRSCRPDGQTGDRFIVDTRAELSVAYADGEAVKWPMSLYMFPQRPARKDQDGTELRYDRTVFFYRGASFEAMVAVQNREMLVRFYDENSDALIRAEDGDQVALDLNGDGWIEPGSKSPEVLPLTAPFFFEGASYRLANVGPRGNGVRAEPSDVPAEPPVYVSPGRPAPDFAATTLDGQPFKLSDRRGKVVLLDFWATWCGPCKDELPNVVRVWEAQHERGLEIVGISLDLNTEQQSAVDTVRPFVAENGMSWTHIVEGRGWESKIGALYQVSAIPRTVLVDREGKIAAVDLRGEALAREVAQLLGGQPGEKAEGTARVPGEEEMPANLTSNRRSTLRHGLQLWAQGDREFAAGHFRDALPPRPCRVLLVAEAIPEALRDPYLEAARAALTRWNQALPQWLDFQVGPRPEESPVQIFFVPTVQTWEAKAQRYQHVCGHTTTDAPHVGKAVPHRHTILVSIYQHGGPTLYSPATITHVVAHELGHVIGIGESDNPADIMGPNSENPSVTLTEADLAAARAVLEFESRMLERAEKQ